MQANNHEWTILEKLLLTQAVHKYGENMWFQVARVLKQHELIRQQGINRPSDFYSQKNCSFQYYLLVEQLESETTHMSRNDLRNDMPVVVRVARHLYAQRMEEIKESLKNNLSEFSQLAGEVNSIRSGQWDSHLQEKLSQQQNGDQKAEAVKKEEIHVNGQKDTNIDTTNNDDKENKIMDDAGGAKRATHEYGTVQETKTTQPLLPSPQKQ
ncbi:hypothetical protein BDF20DRAFT_912180 [Mycotypha africana]|uniref:uncharacterized protein n=1 Tax=Mycotypha africana TaxID=64632 RepID=UPI002301C67A|nr:uncharacterized protein BDF20DRAFT_912180 [Mycotypha africana]KAI8981968.1 hypothetical protein BDF20DRAFT_912180 [Mycotypha africana]